MRAPTGSIYEKDGRWYAVFSLPRRKHFPLAHCVDRAAADARRVVMADVLERLRTAGQTQLVEPVLQDTADADEQRLAKIMFLVEGLVNGREKVVALPALMDPLPRNPTFKQFGVMWTSGELHKLFPSHIKNIDQHDNRPRLEQHVYPFIGHVRMREFTLDHADFAMRQPTLPAGSRRHTALLIHRIATLATYPGKYLTHNPLPRGWLPKPQKGKAKSFVYPSEDAAMMGVTEAPLVLRVLIGLINREGCRPTEAGSIEWSDIDLTHGTLNLDENKTDDPRSWVLDPGTAEALRRWKKIAPKSSWVFPPRALPQARRGTDAPFAVGQLGRQLRDLLAQAGVERAELFVSNEKRQRLRAHDLRASFITVSLALGRSETWVADRTGHTSSVMAGPDRNEPHPLRLALDARERRKRDFT
jgi:integrase